jgi:hypothetical protein
VVRNEVEHQLQSAFPQPRSQALQGRGPAQIAMDGVAPDREAGAGDVVVLEVCQRFGELATPFGVRERDCARRRTGLPATRSSSASGTSSSVARLPSARDSSVSQTRLLTWNRAG